MNLGPKFLLMIAAALASLAMMGAYDFTRPMLCRQKLQT
jgi:hypothetical protein